MNLREQVDRTKNPYEHQGDLFLKAEERLFAYQNEWVSGGGWIEASESTRPERYRYIARTEVRQFDLFFRHHTNHAVMATLEVRRHGEERPVDTFEFTGSFAELCNRIFGPGCQRYSGQAASNESPQGGSTLSNTTERHD